MYLHREIFFGFTTTKFWMQPASPSYLERAIKIQAVAVTPLWNSTHDNTPGQVLFKIPLKEQEEQYRKKSLN